MEKPVRPTFTVTKRMMIAAVVGPIIGLVILVLVVGALINPTDALVVFVYQLVSMVVLAIVGGWLLATLWGWFIVPIFGLSKLSIPGALGVWFITGLLTARYQGVQPEVKHIFDVLYQTIQYVTLYLIVAALGWIVHLFYKKPAE